MRLQEAGNALEPLMAHKFSVIDEIEPGVKSPIEALSEDHTVGLYLDVVPRKVREQLAGFKEISLGYLRPHTNENAEGQEAIYLEAEELRNCQFRAEWLQYMEEGWWATVDEVEYPAREVLGALYYVTKTYGQAHIYLNTQVPMPLWIRPVPLSQPDDGEFVQIMIQARSQGKFIPTNIHTEVSMEFARRWVAAVHGYYKKL